MRQTILAGAEGRPDPREPFDVVPTDLDQLARLPLTAVFDPQHHTRGESEAGSTTQLMEHLGFGHL